MPPKEEAGFPTSQMFPFYGGWGMMLGPQTVGDKMEKLQVEDDIPLRFVVWTTVSQVWTFLAAAYIVIVPLFEEVSSLSVLLTLF